LILFHNKPERIIAMILDIMMGCLVMALLVTQSGMMLGAINFNQGERQ
tara:strand:- start:433 stop:576 length:144 start_codon:yes stop_codon:yes gene_type:complete